MNEETSLSKKEKRALAKEKKQTEKQKENAMSKAKTWGIVLVILGLLGYGGWKFWSWIQTPVDVPVEATMVAESDWVKGNPDAKVTLIEYGDFECPACASYAPLVKQVSDEMSDVLRVVYRHYPLTQIHPNAYPASLASEAAGMQGKFWEMHDMLYEKQDEWSTESNPEEFFVSYAEELGLDLEKFKIDIDSDVVDQAVATDIVLGNQTGISATPTFILNGQAIRAPQSIEAFKTLIESAATTEN